jgi:hypothetical protein
MTDSAHEQPRDVLTLADSLRRRASIVRNLARELDGPDERERFLRFAAALDGLSNKMAAAARVSRSESH